jgi:hypothetical protein
MENLENPLNKVPLVFRIALLACIMTILVMGIYLSRNSSPSRAVNASPVMPMPPGNIAPPQDFLNDYHEYQALLKELNALMTDKSIKRKQDEMTGIVTRLNRSIPQGYVWDESTMSFKPTTPPAPTLPAAVAAPPAPVAAPPKK